MNIKWEWCADDGCKQMCDLYILFHMVVVMVVVHLFHMVVVMVVVHLFHMVVVMVVVQLISYGGCNGDGSFLLLLI